jgi:hypothetical protein
MPVQLPSAAVWSKRCVPASSIPPDRRLRHRYDSRHTPEGLYIYASRTNISCYKSEELVGHSAYEFIPEDVGPLLKCPQKILNSTKFLGVYQAAAGWQPGMDETTSQSIRDPESGQGS